MVSLFLDTFPFLQVRQQNNTNGTTGHLSFEGKLVIQTAYCYFTDSNIFNGTRPD